MICAFKSTIVFTLAVIIAIHLVNGLPKHLQRSTILANGENSDKNERPTAEENNDEASKHNGTLTAETSESEKVSHERQFPGGLRVQTDCKRDKTLIRVNFTRPFSGIMGVGKLETSKCKLSGTGGKFYELQVRHAQANECDTYWDNSTSSLVSSFFIRQHLHLETGNDVAMTVMCKLAVGDLVVGPAKQKAPTNKLKQVKAETTANNKRSAFFG